MPMEPLEEKLYDILIVDDVNQNIQTLAASLSTYPSFNISYSQGGIDALKTMNYSPPDIVLLDITMPEFDGFDVIKAMKSSPKLKDIPVIFLTASHDIESQAIAFNLGAVDYVPKPFNSAIVIKRVQVHLQLKASLEKIALQNYEITQQNEILKQLVATKDKFFSVIAHDLKNPFQVLKNLSKILLKNLDKYDATQTRYYIESIFKSANSAYKLLENLLDWARSQKGAIVFAPVKSPLKNIIDEGLAIFSESTATKELKIQNKVGDDIIVFTDLNMLSTIVNNLISNAIKFSYHKGQIVINVKEYADDPEYWELAIQDFGVGMYPEEMDKLFRLDVHHTSHGTDNESGTGLGLILCREFAEKSGGKIRVESRYGNGSTFYFTVKKYKE